MRQRRLSTLLPALACACLAPAQAQHAATRPATPVAACGLAFDLPAGYKITRPQRTQDPGEGASCAFDIVRAKPAPPPRGDCKDEGDGGQPPYHVCDWMIDAGPAAPSVRVVRAPSGGTPLLDFFVPGDGGSWSVVNAQAGDQPAKAIDFFGKPAWTGTTVVRMYWYRQRVKNHTGIYAGSGGGDVTLVRFAPDLFVQLSSEPADVLGGCTVLCPSLRLGARTQDLP